MKKEEIALQVGNEESILSAFLNEIGQKMGGCLSREEEFELAVKAKEGDREAREKFILSNIFLVVSIAEEWAGKCNHAAAFADLVGEGLVGLMVAVKKFNPHKGFKFSTYAKFWIERMIVDFLQANRRPAIKISISASRMIPRYIKARKESLEKNSRPPFVEEIVEALKIKKSTALALQNIFLEDVSLYEKIHEDSDSLFLDTIKDHKLLPDDELICAEIFAKTPGIIDKMSAKRKAAVLWKLGFLKDGKESVVAVARKYGISKQAFHDNGVAGIKELYNFFNST